MRQPGAGERVCRAAKRARRGGAPPGFAWSVLPSRLDRPLRAGRVQSKQCPRAPVAAAANPGENTMNDSINPTSGPSRSSASYDQYMRFLDASAPRSALGVAGAGSDPGAEIGRLASQLMQEIQALTAAVMNLVAQQLKGQLNAGGAPGANAAPGGGAAPGANAAPGGPGPSAPGSGAHPSGGAPGAVPASGGPAGGGNCGPAAGPTAGPTVGPAAGPTAGPTAGPQPTPHGGGSAGSPLGPDGSTHGDGASMKDKAAKHGMYMGTTVTVDEINDPAFTKKVKDQFGVVAAENAMKWTEIDNKGFGPADKIVDWAQANDIKVRGHTLVWHNQAPDRLNNMSPDQVKKEMQSHITDTVKHFGDKVPTWDVVNEAIKDGGGGFRDSVFSRAMGGQGFLDAAFTAARKAGPNAELALNDYSVETKNAKSDKLYETVKSMKERGIPIDVVGMQAHMNAGDDLSSMAANIKRFTDLGVKVQITELDVKGGDAAAKEATTKDVWNAAVKGGASGLSFWGVSDRYSWIGNDPGLPCDAQMNLKASVKNAIS
jgi:endo-1,4-beta-xylanase